MNRNFSDNPRYLRRDSAHTSLEMTAIYSLPAEIFRPGLNLNRRAFKAV